VDYREPIRCGEKDVPENMQWLRRKEHRRKTAEDNSLHRYQLTKESELLGNHGEVSGAHVHHVSSMNGVFEGKRPSGFPRFKRSIERVEMHREFVLKFLTAESHSLLS
jgi:hypothetical protein